VHSPMEPSTVTEGAAPAPLMPAMADACGTCGTPLAADQRYCLQCGERRGAPRFPFMDGRTPPVAEVAEAASAPNGRSRRPSLPASTALIASIGTLLLAMGVGVLIGRSHDAGTAKAGPVQVLSIAGGGAAPAASTATTATASASTDAGSGAKTPRSSAKAKKASAAASANSIDAAAKKAGVKLPPKSVKLGSKGSGKGYKNGKFTGDFFGP
jgi:hypothetical protein